jgi:hypothetical protein
MRASPRQVYPKYKDAAPVRLSHAQRCDQNHSRRTGENAREKKPYRETISRTPGPSQTLTEGLPRRHWLRVQYAGDSCRARRTRAMRVIGYLTPA